MVEMQLESELVKKRLEEKDDIYKKFTEVFKSLVTKVKESKKSLL